MKDRLRFLRSFAVLAMFLLVFSPLSVFAQNQDDTSIYYVALGDSLAKGMESSGETTEKGYPYYIKQSLENSRYEVDYMNFGVNGYTTSDVLTDLQTIPDIKETLAHADMITISAGANDLLQAIGDIEEIDFGDDEELIALGERVQAAVESVGENTASILTIIREINPEAHIFVMGYYNAMPYLDPPMQEHLVPMLQGLNVAIEQPTNSLGATYVPTFDIFEGNYEEFLPNPNNIHPNEAGYRALASGFMEDISQVYPFLLHQDIVVPLGEKVNVFAGDQLVIGENTLLLPDDLPKGTIVTVTQTDEELFINDPNLQKIGDVLSFDFQFPEDHGNFESTYDLTMNIESDQITEEEIDIFYYNETEKTWEAQQATVDLDNKLATVEVTHFSNYGLFASIGLDVDEEDNVDKEVPVDQEEDEKKQEEQEKTDTSDSGDEGNRLPDTALHHHTWIVLGGVLLLVGLTVLLIRKRLLT